MNDLVREAIEAMESYTGTRPGYRRAQETRHEPPPPDMGQ